jgi:hypothetical protein
MKKRKRNQFELKLNNYWHLKEMSIRLTTIITFNDISFVNKKDLTIKHKI